ncbi:L-ascorbate oxidase-like [Phragmites australis]|uniref:L-ascorbate oxidase-like n=1 Tax=Phragmites australis TaxID=29695 RepID=UPI002D76A7A3|nr:L-ascorbate oxidase-like [Phragmites australis]
MEWPQRLLCCLFLSLSLSALVAHAATHRHKWEISYQFKHSDCVRKLAVTINGQTPGPTIRATQGDTVVVTVKNSLLTENVAIHWHGIRQHGTPWADGTEGVTQCPILPGDTFTYAFVVDRPGTYMYHAHYGMQRSAGLNGMIVVAAAAGGKDAEPFKYDGEHDVLLNDWWHKSTYEQAAGLAAVPIGWVGEPDSLLINGHGRFVNCSTAVTCNATHPECATPVFAVVPGKTYRFRIASVTSLSALNFEIEGHPMTVVEADGHYVKPFVVKNLNIYSGETYSVLIKADQDPNRNYWLASNVVSRKPGTPTGTAILSYYGGRTSPRRPPPTTPPTGPAWNDTMYRFQQSVATVAHPGHAEPPPPSADRTILLLNTQNKIDGRIKWALNNVSFTLPHTPYLVAMKRGLLGAFDQRPPPETYAHQGYDIYAVQKNPNATTSDGLYRLQFGSVVDVVLQNTNMLAPNNSETHPWHLHGHDFWVLGYGIGRFDPAVHPATYNLKDPILKNTVAVHPYGWTALRFRADNPGVWAFHCHIEAHFFMGMGIVFEEGVERVGQLPPEIMGCGKTKGH